MFFFMMQIFCNGLPSYGCDQKEINKIKNKKQKCKEKAKTNMKINDTIR